MIRVLQCVNDMHRAGLETMLMNYYRNIDRSKIQFDFLTHRPERSDYDQEIENLGGKMYYAPRLYPQNYPAYFKFMKKFYKNHPEYLIVHSHIDTMSYLPLLAAKRANVPIRIAHSHNTSIDKDFKYVLKQLFRLGINSVSNVHFACGEEAGRFLFGKESFQIIPNAVDAEQFYFNPNLRGKKRKELNVENKFVVGHVGRISYQKNHEFLVKIFKEITKLINNAVLLIIGIGEKEDEIRRLVGELGLTDSVRFLGNRSDVSELYQAMDVFVLPSLFEGIPVVGIEAQFSDLPCIFSDKVPKEVQFNEKCSFISLKETPYEWAKNIINKYDNSYRSKINVSILKSKYDIRQSYKILEDSYIQLFSKKGGS